MRQRLAPPLRGRAPDFVTELLRTHQGSVPTLGAFPSARYLQFGSGEVIALLSADAVALSIGIVLDLPESTVGAALAALSVDCSVHQGQLLLGESPVLLIGRRDTALRRTGEPQASALASCRQRLCADPRGGPAAEPAAEDVALLVEAGTAPDAVVAGLLGKGPGLTPAGDDLLCGLLAGAVLFGRTADELIAAIHLHLSRRPRATTALSRQLLLRACSGHGIPELQYLGSALCGVGASGSIASALTAVAAIGHTSGFALLAGVLAAAELPTVSLADRGVPAREIEITGSRT